MSCATKPDTRMAAAQPSITTSRLRLRPFELVDATDVRRVAGDRHIAEMTLAIPHPYPEGAAEAWIATHADAYAAGKEATFGITRRDTRALVGAIALLDISREHARGELGYWIGVEYWSHGYCTEAVMRVLQFGREELSLTRFVGRCIARNAASARVMVKAGLQQEGLLRQHMFRQGRYEDMLLFGTVLPDRVDLSDQRPASRTSQ